MGHLSGRMIASAGNQEVAIAIAIILLSQSLTNVFINITSIISNTMKMPMLKVSMLNINQRILSLASGKLDEGVKS